MTPPELVITAPQPGETVTTRTYRFAGTTEPGCTVTAAGRYQADVDANGNWSIVLVLNEGGNVATFVAADEAGNQATAKIAVYYQPPAEADGTVLVANVQGVYQIDPDGQVTTLITGKVASAVDDTRGGLLFQTHKGRNWDNQDDWSTVVWWVPEGRSSPSRLLVPNPGTDHELTLHDTYRTDTGFVVVYTRHEGYTPYEHPPTMHDRLRIYDADTRDIQELYRVRGWEWWLGQVTAGGGLITATEYQVNIPAVGCILVDDKGATVTRPGVPSSRDCFDAEDRNCPRSCALCGDGTRVAYIDPQQPGSASHHIILVRETATGNELARVAIPVPDAGSPNALSIEGSYLLINRFIDHPYSLENFLEAQLFDLGDSSFHRDLAIAGWARIVETAIDIVAPITVSDD